MTSDHATKNFFYSSSADEPDGAFKNTIFNYDALTETCHRIEQQIIDLGMFIKIAVETSLIAFQNE